LDLQPRAPRHNAGVLGPGAHAGGPAQPAQIAAEAEKTAQQFQILEQGLTGRRYVAGEAFTMGDIVVGVTVWRWYALDVKRPRLANLEAYHARLQERPAFRKHVMLPLT
jgi:glutathione S-transferase